MIKLIFGDLSKLPKQNQIQNVKQVEQTEPGFYALPVIKQDQKQEPQAQRQGQVQEQQKAFLGYER